LGLATQSSIACDTYNGFAISRTKLAGSQPSYHGPFNAENTALGRRIKDEPTGIDYLKMLAVSRLFLDNIENFQSSWLTQGLRLGQVALRFGANDMGSIMIEENVVSAAGAHNCADEKMLRFLITEAGFIPQQRDILYKHVNREVEVAV
jgi:cyclic dehypoxanthinyl futalosine synthase